MSTTTLVSSRRRGSVLIIAMVILFAITALVLTLNRQARTQAQAAANDLASQQADSIERGAEAYALALATDYRTTLNTITDQDYAAVPVGTGYFWIVKPDYGDDTQSQFGLLDESTKINLNTATTDELALVPGMTDQIAGAIVDWADADDDLNANGAETATYAGLPTPYNAKNSPFESVDEMSLLYTMTPEILYGDPTAAGTGASSDGSDYYLTHGIADYFTAWTKASPTAADGTTRVNVSSNSALKTELETLLGAGEGDRVANAAGRTRNHPAAVDIFTMARYANINSAEFQQIEDYLTSTPPAVGADPAATPATTGTAGLININTAPREVLLSLTASAPGGLVESDIDAMIAARTSAVQTNPTSMAWLLDAFPQSRKLDGLGNLITSQGAQFSAEIVSVSGNGRGFRHVKIVIDTSTSPPSIIFRHDITDHGWPFDPQLLAQIKTGQQISQGTTQGASLVSGGIH